MFANAAGIAGNNSVVRQGYDPRTRQRCGLSSSRHIIVRREKKVSGRHVGRRNGMAAGRLLSPRRSRHRKGDPRAGRKVNGAGSHR